MNLFDSHAHYNDEKFDNDRKEIIEQTLKNGVSNFVVAGYNIESSKKALNIVKEYKELYSIVGISPNDIEDIKEDKDIDTNILEIEKLIKADDNGKIVAVGEIGLDYYWNKENKELQKIIFKKQIELANKYNLPIVIHTRDAINDTLEIIKNNEVKNRGVFHCCPLNRELVKEALKLGYYISLSGVVTFKNAKNANEIIEMIPENRILIETDSPYLAPEPVRGTRNNCMNVKYVAEKIGKIKKGKYTYIIFSKDFPKSAGNPSSVSAEVEETTGNRLALLCLVAALQRLRRPSLLTIHTDNRYLQNGYQSISAWKENGWTRTGNQELRNADLWQQVDKLLSGHAVRFKIES